MEDYSDMKRAFLHRKILHVFIKTKTNKVSNKNINL